MHDSAPSSVKGEAAARFWHGYFQHLKKHHVPESSRHWYRWRVEAYIRHHDGRKLALHQASDVIAYLNLLARKPSPEVDEDRPASHPIGHRVHHRDAPFREVGHQTIG